MNQIRVSAIIPVYNAEKTLSQCLDSVLFQSLKELEIIIVNDGSADGSKRIIDDYQKDDERIRTFEQDNKGSGPARNIGISSAKGEYISFLDADDKYPEKDVLKKLYEKAVENKADICGGSLLIDLDGKLVDNRNELDRFDNEGWIRFSDYQWDYGFYRYLFNRKFLIAQNITFPDLRRYQDPPFLLDAMTQADRFYAITDPVYQLRIRKENYDGWSFEKINDMAKGLLLNLKKAKENDLEIVVRNNISRVDHDYRYAFVSSIKKGNKELIGLLNEIDKYTPEQIDPIRIMNGDDQTIPALEKGIIRNIKKSIKENGLKYTLHRILFHLHLRKDNDPERTVSKI